MDKQEFINYINEELGLYLDETSPAYPYIGELYKALLPYEEELKAGTYRLLSSDNYEACYDDFSHKVADIDVPIGLILLFIVLQAHTNFISNCLTSLHHIITSRKHRFLIPKKKPWIGHISFLFVSANMRYTL